jgi:flagellar biosynthesis GTPase FlhF
LRKEKVSREISRFLNQMRKEADYSVNNRIVLNYSTNSDYLKSVISQYKDFFQKEVLITKINELSSLDNTVYDIKQETNFDDESIIFLLKR